MAIAASTTAAMPTAAFMAETLPNSSSTARLSPSLRTRRAYKVAIVEGI